MALRQVRRITSYGVCRDDAGRVLLVRAPEAVEHFGVATPRAWNLPGGGIAHGEDPAVAIVRRFWAELGLVVEVLGVRSVSLEMTKLVELGFLCHSDQVIYDLRLVGRTEGAGAGTPAAGWFALDEMRELPVYARVAAALGVEGAPRVVEFEAIDGVTSIDLGPGRGQRFSAYGVVTDASDRILLTLIAPNYPGAGTWHLPGGGTDFGEDAIDGLLREIVEESGQTGRIVSLIGVTNLHNPAARGPEKRPLDWHGVRVTYRVIVDSPTVPIVGEVDGSTADAQWFTSAEVMRLRLNRPAAGALIRAGVLERDARGGRR